MRKNAVLASLTIYKHNEALIPDAPELIQNYLGNVRAVAAPPRAVRPGADMRELPRWPTVMAGCASTGARHGVPP